MIETNDVRLQTIDLTVIKGDGEYLLKFANWHSFEFQFHFRIGLSSNLIVLFH